MVGDPLVLFVRSFDLYLSDNDPIGHYLMLSNLNTSFWSFSVAFLPYCSENGSFFFFSNVCSLKCLLKILPRNSHKCKFALDSVRPLLILDVGIPTYAASES
jgi:hypothetical protein